MILKLATCCFFCVLLTLVFCFAIDDEIVIGKGIYQAAGGACYANQTLTQDGKLIYDRYMMRCQGRDFNLWLKNMPNKTFERCEFCSPAPKPSLKCWNNVKDKYNRYNFTVCKLEHLEAWTTDITLNCQDVTTRRFKCNATYADEEDAYKHQKETIADIATTVSFPAATPTPSFVTLSKANNVPSAFSTNDTSVTENGNSCKVSTTPSIYWVLFGLLLSVICFFVGIHYQKRFGNHVYHTVKRTADEETKDEPAPAPKNKDADEETKVEHAPVPAPEQNEYKEEKRNDERDS